MRRARVHWGDAYLFSCTRDRWVGAARLLGERQPRLEAAAAVAYRTNRAMLIHPHVRADPVRGWEERQHRRRGAARDPGGGSGRSGVQVGEGTQDNTFIQNYIAQQVIQPPEVATAGPVVAGEVPQPPPAFQSRADLLAALRKIGPGVSVMRSVTGMRGVGKTQVAAVYARWCIDGGWRLVAWINAGDTAQVLNGLAVVAARPGIGAPGAGLEEIAALVRNRLEADGDRCLVVFDNLADPDGVPSGPPISGAKRRSGRAAPITDVITVPSHTKKDNPKAALKPHPHRQ